MGKPLDGIALQTFFRNFNFSPERQERLASQETQELLAKIRSSPPSRSRRVARLLKNPAQMRMPEARKSWQATRQELALASKASSH